MAGFYSIEELADESGFDKRVIRSFIEQGLLKGPESKGRYARYSELHLIRLKTIRYLRDARQMTLGEIRVALMSMTDKDMRSLASRENEIVQEQFSGSSILDYLRTARHPAQVKGMSPNLVAEQPPALSAVEKLLHTLQENLANKNLSAQSKGQNWHRFAITPDIEVSVRGLQDGGQIEQWNQIADCLREILLGGSTYE